MHAPRTIAELIALWPSAEVFSDDLGLKWRSHGRVMKVRRRIPVAYWDAVVSSARRRGIGGITHDLLKELHSQPPPRHDAEGCSARA